MQCRDEGEIPASLRIKPLVRTRESYAILEELHVQVGYYSRDRGTYGCPLPLLIELTVVTEAGGLQAELKELC